MSTSLRLFSFLVLGSSLFSNARVPEWEPVFERFHRGSALVPLGGDAESPQDWFNLDRNADGVEGVSADKAYAQFGSGTPSADIVVAVLDSGVDIHHEDLVGKIWTNPGESGLDSGGRDRASNGLDDDQNGYIDDVHGWNFLGSYDDQGKPVHLVQETLEMTRILKKLSDLKNSGVVLTPEQEALLSSVRQAVQEERAASTSRLSQVSSVLQRLQEAFAPVAHLVDVPFEELALSDVKNWDESQELLAKAKKTILALFEEIERESVDILRQIVAYHENVLATYLNTEFDPRSKLVGDNPEDFQDTRYGNHDVTGPDADHGTHVAGIIAANRNNLLGVRGVADKVKIMSLRMVPDGDERDKDVALAIRYAVDNGARVINMSFGKGFSPQKALVDEALQYAADHGVLLVHAAGNDATDNDASPSFPNRYRENGEEIATWLDVGASAKIKGREMVADFSNYGKVSVDLFAPGHDVESTIPGGDYAVYSGTSMASPTVAGVAALLLAHLPQMQGVELKDLLLGSGTAYPGLEVLLPGSETLVPFERLSSSGKVVNVMQALEQQAFMLGYRSEPLSYR